MKFLQHLGNILKSASPEGRHEIETRREFDVGMENRNQEAEKERRFRADESSIAHQRALETGNFNTMSKAMLDHLKMALGDEEGTKQYQAIVSSPSYQAKSKNAEAEFNAAYSTGKLPSAGSLARQDVSTTLAAGHANELAHNNAALEALSVNPYISDRVHAEQMNRIKGLENATRKTEATDPELAAEDENSTARARIANATTTTAVNDAMSRPAPKIEDYSTTPLSTLKAVQDVGGVTPGTVYHGDLTRDIYDTKGQNTINAIKAREAAGAYSTKRRPGVATPGSPVSTNSTNLWSVQ